MLVGIEDVLAFAHEAMPLAKGSAGAEVMSSRHRRKFIQLARIPLAYPLSIHQIQFDFIFYVKAEAGWTNIGTCRTR
jgi:hypothetical protein